MEQLTPTRPVISPERFEPPPVRAAIVATIVFVVGAASLGSEIGAARLLAPFFGASTFVWANTIATVLVALAVGYWLGGKLADRRPTLGAAVRVDRGRRGVACRRALRRQPPSRRGRRALD